LPRLQSGLRNFFAEVWRRAESPVVEIVVHLLVTTLSILSIGAIEGLIILLGLDKDIMPFTSISLREWMLYLEVIAATLIIAVGIIKAVIALIRG